FEETDDPIEEEEDEEDEEGDDVRVQQKQQRQEGQRVPEVADRNKNIAATVTMVGFKRNRLERDQGGMFGRGSTSRTRRAGRGGESSSASGSCSGNASDSSSEGSD
ncbi:unnamed protein product, partial [Discosporangium mesarthrocarpum]